MTPQPTHKIKRIARKCAETIAGMQYHASFQSPFDEKIAENIAIAASYRIAAELVKNSGALEAFGHSLDVMHANDLSIPEGRSALANLRAIVEAGKE